jgi:hypothetical protein
MPNTKQAVFIGRVETVLSSSRLAAYAVSPSEQEWERFARYAWNVAIGEAFYPLLNHLEIILRNRVYELGAAAYPVGRVHHIRTWLDADPTHLTAFAVGDIAKAKRKLFGVDRRTGALITPRRQYTGGDLVATLGFGFWTSLFTTHYHFQSGRDRRLWPHGLADVFPYAPTKLSLGAISRRLNDLRHLRNRIFHHEPVWQRANLAADRDDIIELLEWMSPEVARVIRGTERLTEVIAPDFRRRLRVRIYRECRR